MLHCEFSDCHYGSEDIERLTIVHCFYVRLLAHDIEEENDSVADYMTLIWDNHSIRKNGEKNYIPLRRLRYDLFVRLGFRALVSRRCIEEV